MVSKVHSVNLLISSCVFLCLALICFAVGIYGNAWWITKTINGKITIGLWQTCNETNGEKECHKRTDVLTFDSSRGADPIILCICLASLFVKISLTISFSMLCCCRSKPTTWLKAVKWNVIAAIVSIVCIADAVLYTEIEFRDWFKRSERGWACYVTWVGAGLQFVGFVLLLLQLCLKPRVPIHCLTHAW